MASIKDLQDQMNKNSQAWHGANKAEQDRLHKENERLQSQIDSMTGGSSTFNPGTGKWSTTGGSSASRPSGVGGSRPSGGSSSRPSGGNWSTGSNGYGSSYGTDASGQNDYSVLIRDAMNAGASADEVQRLLDQRVNKAQQSGYNQYMYDDLYHAAQNYIKQQTQLPQVEDYSDYLADAFAAQKRAALAQINNAYQQNVNAINRAGEGVDTRYQNARNQAAGASELAARNFNEYAAAAGLNSGAGGQAELARNVALQNNLNDLSTAEAQTYADLEQQMANAEVEYNNAIAEAEANGDAALASALYQEKVRVQQANAAVSDGSPETAAPISAEAGCGQLGSGRAPADGPVREHLSGDGPHALSGDAGRHGHYGGGRAGVYQSAFAPGVPHGRGRPERKCRERYWRNYRQWHRRERIRPNL